VRAPRPVAGLPAIGPSELAKAWLLELIAAAPLEQAADLRVAEFTQHAPVLCAAVLAALADDAALDELGPADPAWGVEALRQVATRTLRATIEDRETALDAVDRLAHVAARLAAMPSAAAAVPATRLEQVLAGMTEPFVLLAAELTWQHADDAARERAESAIRAHLRSGDQLLQAGPSRWWLIAPGTDAATARGLAAAIGDSGELAFGLAACPHDGIDAEALVAHADEALFSARAAGLPVA
jgi:GGDEF domain-containing protein